MMAHNTSSFVNRLHRHEAGFTLVELMVGLVIGILATLAIAQVMSSAEGNKRGTTSGSDAQVAGALALFGLQREIEMAGYGISSTKSAIGCALSARYGGAAVASFPNLMAPVVITQGAGGAPDTVQVLSSGTKRFAVPMRAIPPYYNPEDQNPGGPSFGVPVSSALGVQKGDLVANIVDSTQPCEVFEVTDEPAAGRLPREDNGRWNSNKFPTLALTKTSFVVNLGQLNAKRFGVTNNTLWARDYDLSKRDWSDPQELQAGVVNMQALYGKDTNADGRVDRFDTVTPTTNAEWEQVLAVRLAVVVRSGQYERNPVTDNASGDLDGELWWDVGRGKAVTVDGAVDCLSGSKCLKLKVNFADNAEWKHYRYKVFDTVVPLRNMVWDE